MAKTPTGPRPAGATAQGVRVGRLEVLDRIGSGGVAEVYRAIRRKPGTAPQLVALKRMKADAPTEGFFAERFMAEADVVQMLRHPNVVGGDEVGTLEGRPYVVMECIDGVDLDSVMGRLRAAGRLMDTGTAIHVVMQLLRGLGYVHALTTPTGRPLRIVHRDVTPGNVLIGYDGQVALTDFGIALLDGIEAGAEDGPVAGKLGYMAPEQATRAALDRRADLFAAGCMLYALTVGKGPFDAASGEKEAEVAARVMDARFARPSKVVPDYPNDLENVVMKAMEKKARNRFKDAEAFLTALDELAFVRRDEPNRLAALVRELFADQYERTRLVMPAE